VVVPSMVKGLTRTVRLLWQAEAFSLIAKSHTR